MIEPGTSANYVNCQQYRLNVTFVKETLRRTISDGRDLKNRISEIVASYGGKLDLSKPEEVTRFIRYSLGEQNFTAKEMSKSSLESLYEKTQNQFFKLLVDYKKCKDKYMKLSSFITAVIDDTFDQTNLESVNRFLNTERTGVKIKPTFIYNRAGTVSMTNPPLPFTREEIKELFNFNVAITSTNVAGTTDVTSELISVFEKYFDLIIGYKRMILGNTLYANMILDNLDIIPFTENEDEVKKLIKEFHVEFGNQLESPTEEIKEHYVERFGYNYKAQVEHVERTVGMFNQLFDKLEANKESENRKEDV